MVRKLHRNLKKMNVNVNVNVNSVQYTIGPAPEFWCDIAD